jgi:hypothetical protein
MQMATISNLDKERLMQHLRGIRKIVINDCFGGYGLSEAAVEEYKRMACIDDPEFTDQDIDRDDPYLVRLVEEWGDRAEDNFAQLKVVEVPAEVDWIIQEYDGHEWIAEKHRTWR